MTKITGFSQDYSPELATSLTVGTGAGGDLGGSLPGPTVVGINGQPISGTASTGQVLYFNGTNWIDVALILSGTHAARPAAATTNTGWLYFETDTGSGFLSNGSSWVAVTTNISPGLTSVTDGTTTVSSVTTETVPLGGVTSLGGGNAGLNYLTSVYGGQDKVHTVAASGAAQTIDCSIANIFDLTLTATCTLTITNPPPVEGSIVLILRQGGSGSYTVTWPGSVSWQNPATGASGGSAPTLWTAVGAMDVVVLTTLDGGTTWGGSPAPHLTGGTVTSVGLSMPAEFSVGSSPVTGAGTIAVTKANESANTVWAGPTSGSAAAPTFRALVAADIPAGVGTVGVGTYGLLVQDGATFPPVSLYLEDGSDWLYADGP